MMALALACAVLILDHVAERLGFAISPWEMLQSARVSRHWRVAECALSVLALRAVAALNVYTVVKITPTREEAAKLRHNISSPDLPPAPLDEQKVSDAVLWFSISVTIGAALLPVTGAAEARPLRRRGLLPAHLWRLRRTLRRLEEKASTAVAAMEAAHAGLDLVPTVAAAEADRISNQRRARVEERIQPRPAAPKSALEIVETALCGLPVRKV